MTAQFNMPSLFAQGAGYGEALLLFGLLVIFIVCFLISGLVVVAWVLRARIVTKTRIGIGAKRCALIFGTVGGWLYCFVSPLPDSRVRWVLALLGAFVVTNATLVVIALIRADQQSKESKGQWWRIQLRLRTLLSLVAVAAVILATLLPAFHFALAQIIREIRRAL